MKISVTLLKQDDKVIATCPELEINCYASNPAEATDRIKKVISFYVDSARDLGLDVQDFDAVMIDGQYSGELERFTYSGISDSLN
ncbi:MAG: hypothetical protein ACOC2H_00490 [Spirochaetota bacterium]